MKVELLHHTPLWVASKAIRKCWASEGKSDTLIDGAGKVRDTTVGQLRKCEAGTKDKELIHRVGNKFKHASTLEHLNYTFDVDGVSRALLQEKARHRHASISVKSSRYTLKEVKELTGAYEQFLVPTGNDEIDYYNYHTLKDVSRQLRDNKVPNDVAKYMLPEAYKTSYVWTVNARSLQNFLALRTNKAALWEVRELAYELYNKLPEEHKYLFSEFLYKEKEDVR